MDIKTFYVSKRGEFFYTSFPAEILSSGDDMFGTGSSLNSDYICGVYIKYIPNYKKYINLTNYMKINGGIIRE